MHIPEATVGEFKRDIFKLDGKPVPVSLLGLSLEVVDEGSGDLLETRAMKDDELFIADPSKHYKVAIAYKPEANDCENVKDDVEKCK